MKRETFYLSCDKRTKIHAVAWKPESLKVKAVIQICHGMAEYIDWYEEFALWLCGKGYYVTGHDHLGHGKSIFSEEDYGYFPEKQGNECVIGDIQKLYLATKKRYPDCPYFMIGHSMGSFLLRQYIQKYGSELDGAVIMGTGYQPYPLLLAGEILCSLIGRFRGDHYRSRLVDSMAFGSYNKEFEPGKTGREWLSADEGNVTRYEADPLCGFLFTVSGYRQMFRGMRTLTKKGVKEIPKGLPVFFVSGAKDPVGDFGAGVWKVYEQFRKAGISDTTIRLYADDRHEILHEEDRMQVFEKIENWITERITK
ncbi:MAG TPA: lysophospholipase [Candidatus Sellimonas avistercoris]|nr:lysophospholipase [Candidatus Sellimonas avistercoris]